MQEFFECVCLVRYYGSVLLSVLLTTGENVASLSRVYATNFSDKAYVQTSNWTSDLFSTYCCVYNII